MIPPRLIPILLLQNNGLVKTEKYKNPKYIGDPINTVKIFNEKEVDELVFLDISATIERRKPRFELLYKIASECFMPLGYGGGISTIEDIKTLFSLGIEKVIINHYAIENPDFIKKAAVTFGSQSIVVSIDVKKSIFGKYELYNYISGKSFKYNPIEFAELVTKNGAGELIINSVDKEGTMLGYDTKLLEKITVAVSIPVVANGGAGRLEDFREVIHEGGAAAAAAGSFFVYKGKHRAVLINYPKPSEVKALFMN